MGQKNLKWALECKQAFKQVKAILAKDVFIQYPDHDQPFHIYMDASDYQMGVVIVQNDKPVAYFSHKLNSAQRNYTTGKKELLSIMDTLKEYCIILVGCQELHIYRS